MATRFLLAVILLAAVSVMATAASSPSPAHAQGIDDSLPPLADLSIVADHDPRNSPRWRLTVRNNRVGSHPGATASLVRVEITRRDADGNDETSIRTIRDLRVGASATMNVFTPAIQATNDGPARAPMRLHAKIIETDPAEPPGFQHNNETEHWAMANRRPNPRPDSFTNGNAGVGVSITGSDRFPPAEGATTFTVYATNDTVSVGIPPYYPGTSPGFKRYDSAQLDVRVKISLSPGLSFSSTQQAPSGTTFDPDTGVWDVGAIEDTDDFDFLSLPVAVNLTADSLADLPLEERCLTAKVVNAVPWFAYDFLKRINDTATACLGAELLSGGTMDLISFYPCINDTSTPCTSADTLELVAARSVGDHSDYLQPESVIVHVPDPGGRTLKGGSVIWSTVNLMDLRDEQTRLTSSWSIKESVKVTAPGGGDAPGRWLLTNTDDSTSGNFDLLDAMDSSTVTYDFFDLSDIGTDPTEYYIDVKVDFWALGTYKALLGLFGRLSGTTYTDSGTYTFHVGPMADLKVRDTGASLEVPAGQRAFSILAVNHGPDDAPAVEVKITGLKANDVQSYSATRGSFNPDSGVWTIVELKTKDRVRAASGRDGEVLTIIPNSSADKEIGATISNTQDYQVCIDSSGDDVEASSESACEGTTGNTWHTTKYYDRVKGNDSATVSQHKGTGALLPTLQVSGLGGAAMLARWTELPSLYKRKVTHYEIERSTDGGKSWTMLDDQVVKTVYVDLDATPANNPTYRVRAVNGLFHKGPWSSLLGPTGSVSPRGTAEAPGAPVNVGAAADGGSAIDVRWDAPTEDGGAPVTRYEVQWSADGESGWRRAGYVQNLTYKHSGLSFGDTRYYRVRAQNSGGWGAWSDLPASATTRAGVPDAPTLTTHNSTADTIRLRWTEPRDNGGAITSYELEWSPDGRVDSCESLDTLTASDEGFSDREYNDTGNGDILPRARGERGGRGTLVGREERGRAARDAGNVLGRAQRSQRHPAHLDSAGRRHQRQHGHALRTGGVHGRREQLEQAVESGGDAADPQPHGSQAGRHARLPDTGVQRRGLRPLVVPRFGDGPGGSAIRVQPDRAGQQRFGDQAVLEQAQRRRLGDRPLRTRALHGRRRLDVSRRQHSVGRQGILPPGRVRRRDDASLPGARGERRGRRRVVGCAERHDLGAGAGQDGSELRR